MRKRNLIFGAVLSIVFLVFLVIAQTDPTSLALSLVSDSAGNVLVNQGEEQLAKFPPGYDVEIGEGDTMTAKNTGAEVDQIIEFKGAEIETDLGSEIKMTDNPDETSIIEITKGKGNVKIGDQNFNEISNANFKMGEEGEILKADFTTKNEGSWKFDDSKGNRFWVNKKNQDNLPSEGSIKFDSENKELMLYGGGKIESFPKEFSVQNYAQKVELNTLPPGSVPNKGTIRYNDAGKIDYALIRDGSYSETKYNIPLSVDPVSGDTYYMDVVPTFSSSGEEMEIFIGGVEQSTINNRVIISEVKGGIPIYQIDGKVKLKDFERQYRGFDTGTKAYYYPKEELISIYTTEGISKVANGNQVITLDNGKIKFSTNEFGSSNNPFKIKYQNVESGTVKSTTNLVLGKQTPNSGVMANANIEGKTTQTSIENIVSYAEKFLAGF